MVIEEENWAAVAEIKFDTEKSAETLIKEAFKQIDEKEYYEQYMDKKVILLAIAYTPQIIKCEIKPLKRLFPVAPKPYFHPKTSNAK